MPRVSSTAKAFTVSLALVVTCVFVDTAQAQRGGGRGGRPTDMVTLAANEQVQKELSVTDEQKTKITKIAEDFRAEVRPLMSGLRELEPAEAQKKIAEAAPKRLEIAAKYEKELAGVLKEDQQKRLKEITLHVQGAGALLRPDVASALKLTDDQKKKIQAAIDSQGEKMRQAFAEAGQGGDRDAATKKFTEIRETSESEAMAVLTKEQKAQLEKMKGKEFKLERQRRNRDSA